MLKGLIDVGLHLAASLVRFGRSVDGGHWLPALSVEAEQRGGDHLQVQTIFAHTQSSRFHEICFPIIIVPVNCFQSKFLKGVAATFL